MKRILLILSFLIITTTSFAQEPILDAETKEICNKVLLNIYYDISEQKDKYKELMNFGEQALFENKHGIIAIIYKFGKDDENQKDKRKTPYEFGVTIDTMEDVSFSHHLGKFNYGFNLLGLKICGYQKKHILRTQFNILPLINKHGTLLANHQQKYMPLKIFLDSPKDEYSVREDIVFSLTLKNVSKRHMIVKSLGEKTLYFLVNGRSWGTSSSTKKVGGKKVILKAGESIKMHFKGESFQIPQDIIINAYYKMAIKGVYPSTSFKIKIVD